MTVTATAMRGRALHWWIWWSLRHPASNWDTFTTDFLWRFKPEWRQILPVLDEEMEPDSELLTSVEAPSLIEDSVPNDDLLSAGSVSEVPAATIDTTHSPGLWRSKPGLGITDKLVSVLNPSPPSSTFHIHCLPPSEILKHRSTSGFNGDDISIVVPIRDPNPYDRGPLTPLPPNTIPTAPEPPDKFSVPPPAPPKPPDLSLARDDSTMPSPPPAPPDRQRLTTESPSLSHKSCPLVTSTVCVLPISVPPTPYSFSKAALSQIRSPPFDLKCVVDMNPPSFLNNMIPAKALEAVYIGHVFQSVWPIQSYLQTAPTKGSMPSRPKLSAHQLHPTVQFYLPLDLPHMRSSQPSSDCSIRVPMHVPASQINYQNIAVTSSYINSNKHHCGGVEMNPMKEAIDFFQSPELDDATLILRLLRQGGYYVNADLFVSLMRNRSNFKSSIVGFLNLKNAEHITVGIPYVSSISLDVLVHTIVCQFIAQAIIVNPTWIVFRTWPTIGGVFIRDFIKSFAKCLENHHTTYALNFLEGNSEISELEEPLKIMVLFQHVKNLLPSDSIVMAAESSSLNWQYRPIDWFVDSTLNIISVTASWYYPIHASFDPMLAEIFSQHHTMIVKDSLSSALGIKVSAVRCCFVGKQFIDLNNKARLLSTVCGDKVHVVAIIEQGFMTNHTSEVLKGTNIEHSLDIDMPGSELLNLCNGVMRVIDGAVRCAIFSLRAFFSLRFGSAQQWDPGGLFDMSIAAKSS